MTDTDGTHEITDSCCDKQGQRYGIASCRELVTARIAPLVKS